MLCGTAVCCDLIRFHLARSTRSDTSSALEGEVLTDARKLPVGTLLRTQVCVIGSGAAGITAALEVGQARHHVILLEGGGHRPQRRHQDTYKGRVEPSDLYRPELRSLHPPLDT